MLGSLISLNFTDYILGDHVDVSPDDREEETERRKSFLEPEFEGVVRWLDIYFGGEIPDFEPIIKLMGTPFQNEVWGLLRSIPYGKVTTYGEISKMVSKDNSTRLSMAVGRAVARNEIALIVPCHRVLGAGGRLGGYPYGPDMKAKLLCLEATWKPST
ncbi:MAG: methylated-DNA--[protein]-cysteine S-methyltransferase [Deltaproteobacteria bacterium]|nr:methylated-DNA--[protein]-cysteine S-methyltransferase [Deltaproteobacteria bacterium]